MKIEKHKCRVRIVCRDGSELKGFIHINPGERVLDFINDTRENFIAVTDTESGYTQRPKAFKLVTKLAFKKNTIILNKDVVKWIEEI